MEIATVPTAPAGLTMVRRLSGPWLPAPDAVAEFAGMDWESYDPLAIPRLENTPDSVTGWLRRQ
jgi:hypothetical protein